MLLEVKDLHVAYGAIKGLEGISFHVDEGEIVTLIGANGAGKSTTLRTISGIVRPSSGDIRFMGKSIITTSADHIVGMGISHVPEGRRIFANLSVEENLQLAAWLRWNKDREGVKRDRKDDLPFGGERGLRPAFL